MVKWELDRQAATICGEFGEWKQRIVTQSEIDEKASRQNSARRESFDSQLADEYAAAMRDGAVFPCIVCVRIDGADRLVIAGGNHRHAAARKLKDGEFLAIVMSLPQADFMLLAKRLNVVNGKREDNKARAEAAADLVRFYGRTISDAARAMGISMTMVSAVIAKRELEEIALRLRRPTPSTPITVADVAKPLFRDADLAPLCLDLLALNPTTKDVSDVAASVRRAKSLAERKTIIAEAIDLRRKDMKSTGGASKPVRAQINRMVGGLVSILNRGDSLCYLQMTKQEALLLSVKMGDLAAKIEAIAEATTPDT